MSFDPTVDSYPSTLQLLQPPTPPRSKKRFQNKTWQEAAGEREVTAPLAALPLGVAFGEDFPEPIQYDAARRVLRYRGFMSNTSFQELQHLSNDLFYMRALEQLFTASAIEPESKTNYHWMIGGVAILFALAVLGWRWIAG